MEQAPFPIWTKKNQTLNRNPSYGDYSWEEQAFAEDALGPLGGCVWPPRSYFCSFCRREFRSAQALGGHMNVHRRDRARLKQYPAVSQVFDPPDQYRRDHHVSTDFPYLPPQDCGYNPNPNPNCDLVPTTFVSPTSTNSRVSATPIDDDHGNYNLKMNPVYLSNTKPIVPSPQSRPNSATDQSYRNAMISQPEKQNSEDIGHDQDDSIKDAIPLSLNLLIRARLDAVSIDKEEVRGGKSKRRRLDDSSSLLPFFFDEINRTEKKIHEFSSITEEDDLDLELRLGGRLNKKVKLQS